jgi:hypothetical protein
MENLGDAGLVRSIPSSPFAESSVANRPLLSLGQVLALSENAGAVWIVDRQASSDSRKVGGRICDWVIELMGDAALEDPAKGDVTRDDIFDLL